MRLEDSDIVEVSDLNKGSYTVSVLPPPVEEQTGEIKVLIKANSPSHEVLDKHVNY